MRPPGRPRRPTRNPRRDGTSGLLVADHPGRAIAGVAVYWRDNPCRRPIVVTSVPGAILLGRASDKAPQMRFRHDEALVAQPAYGFAGGLGVDPELLLHLPLRRNPVPGLVNAVLDPLSQKLIDLSPPVVIVAELGHAATVRGDVAGPAAHERDPAGSRGIPHTGAKL